MSDRPARPQRPNRQMSAPAPSLPSQPESAAPRYESFVGRSPLPSLSEPEPFEGEQNHTVVLKEDGGAQAPQALRARLTAVAGEQEGESWVLNRAVTRIGRALDNDIVLLDIAASRRHLELHRHGLGFSFKDLKSANGVALNGRRSLDDELYDGDVIEVGETQLRFEMIGAVRQRPLEEEEADTNPGVTPLPPSEGRAAPLQPPARRAPPLPPASFPVPPRRQTSPIAPAPSPAPSPAPVAAPPPPPPPPPVPPSLPPSLPLASAPSRAPLSAPSAPSKPSAPSPSAPSPSPSPSPSPMYTGSMLPFSPPRWEAEHDDVIALEGIPLPAPRAGRGEGPVQEPAPVASNTPWKTMGLSGLTPQDLDLPPPSPWRARRRALAEEALNLWDAALLKTGLDRVPPAHLTLIALALAGSLMLGRYLGYAARPNAQEVTASIRQALSLGDVSLAERILKETRDELPPEVSAPLDEALSLERGYEAVEAEVRAAAQAGDLRALLRGFSSLPPSHPRASALAPLARDARGRLIEVSVNAARQHLWRGELTDARRVLDELTPLGLTHAELPPQVSLLHFALALHAEEPELSELKVNPSPREQRALESAAQLISGGDRKGATRELRDALPQGGPRRALFELRLRALEPPEAVAKAIKAAQSKNQYTEVLKLRSADYLVATEMRLDELRALYAKTLNTLIDLRRYVEVASVLRLALILNPGDAALINLKRQLEENARQWFKRAQDAAARGDMKEVKTLLKAAENFLSPEERAQAQALSARVGR